MPYKVRKLRHSENLLLTAVLSLCQYQISLCLSPGREFKTEVSSEFGNAGGFQHLPCLDGFSPIELMFFFHLDLFSCLLLLVFSALHFKVNLHLSKVLTLNRF